MWSGSLMENDVEDGMIDDGMAWCRVRPHRCRRVRTYARALHELLAVYEARLRPGRWCVAWPVRRGAACTGGSCAAVPAYQCGSRSASGHACSV